MNWIAILFAVELGVLPMGGLNMYKPITEPFELTGNYYSEMGAEILLWDALYFGGSSKIYFSDVAESYQFYPHGATFLVEGGLRYRGFTLGFRHYCSHPIMPMFPNPVEKIWDGGYEEAFIRFEAKIGGKH